MPRYIDADQIQYHYLPIPAIGDMYVAKLDIMKIPTADVEKIIHGSWIKKDIFVCSSDGHPIVKFGERYTCSICGRVEDKSEPYCHCGAKMNL